MIEENENLFNVKKLLDEHRLVETFFAQDAPLQENDDDAEYWHNLAALRDLLSRIPSEEIVRVIEALDPAERLLVWNEVREDRGESLLDMLDDGVRGGLVWDSHFRNKKTMVCAFELRNGRLSQISVNTPDDLKMIQPIWVDLVAPTPEIRSWIGRFFDIDLPNPGTLTDLEASARFYVEENGEIHLHSDFLFDSKEESRNVAVALILHRDILFTVRTEELPVFRLQRLRARTQPGYVTDGKDVLLDLYAADAEYSADALEDIYAELGEVSRHVLGTELTDAEAAKILADIAREEDLNGRIRRNVHDTRRAVSFLTRGKFLNPNQLEDALQIMRDIESLDGHTSFLFGKINFLMDATVGFININQNKVIKIFSVASVALLPPTLIASIYGMNFKGWFPELDWEYGYPFSLLLMALSVGFPIWFFRKKGWLN
ncbi:MAG: magnesium/cobalt transporter CorA [Candidatus Accumulibacter sp.]|jgi:magnesium transporter|nr:magnesium/cobalt transporter CorA [Accumulibacter sp.]